MRNTNKNEKKLLKNNIGFYIALGICIVTIAAAAWTTYGSVLEYQRDSTDGTDSSEVEAAEDVSGESYERTLPADDESSAEEPQKESSEQKEEPSEEESQTENVSAEETSKSVVYPVADAKVMKGFSVSAPVFSKTTSDWRTHGGVDFEAPKGTAVCAVSYGTVKTVGNDPMFGNYIIIEHGKCTAKYYGLSDKGVVSEGDNVEAGSTIGYVGTVPCEMLDGDHIHIETLVNGAVTDPAVILEDRHK